MELRVGHKGADGTFQNAEIPINHGSEIIKGRSLVNQRAICPNAAFPAIEIQERVPDSETIRTFRTSLSILGDGFVEAIDDSTLIDISNTQCKQDREDLRSDCPRAHTRVSGRNSCRPLRLEESARQPALLLRRCLPE